MILVLGVLVYGTDEINWSHSTQMLHIIVKNVACFANTVNMLIIHRDENDVNGEM